ncbi:hypothetical protein [Aeromonas salmonicida]|uniref:hypothetical protein n=1 Tax=Aeromonas salmonicida TaxID=645 RepID=UPI003D25EAAC
MDSGNILTMLGLIAAVLAIIPKESKLDLSLRISKFDWIVIITCLISIHYIMYYPVLNAFGLEYNFGTWKYGFTENNATYLIFLFISLYLTFRFRTFNINNSNVKKFGELLEQLVLKKKYDEASHLIEKYFKDIEKIRYSDNLRNKIAKKLRPKNDFEALLDIENKVPSNKFISDKTFIKLSSVIRVDDTYRDYASTIIYRLFQNKGFISFLAEFRPYYLLKTLTSKSLRSEVPLKQFFNSLIDDKSSVFYYEIENNTNLEAEERYYIDPNNKLLFGLLHDCKVAKEMAVYKPIGDKISDLIDYDSKLIEKYNEPLGNYHENGLYQCPIYCGLQFFNIMILESLHQNIKWHMWLYYYQSFTRKIIKSLNTESMDVDREWPTPFHFHLYKMTGDCLGWIYARISDEKHNTLKLDNLELIHDNNSILKSSILCLGNLAYQIISTNKLSRTFKVYILEIILKRIRNNGYNSLQESANKLLVKSIIYNGYANKLDSTYIEMLSDLFHEVDHLITSELYEFKHILNIALKS